MGDVSLTIRVSGLCALEWSGDSEPGQNIGKMKVHFASAGDPCHRPLLIVRRDDLVDIRSTPPWDYMFIVPPVSARSQTPASSGERTCVAWRLEGCQMSAGTSQNADDVTVCFGGAGNAGTQGQPPASWNCIDLLPDLLDACGLKSGGVTNCANAVGSLTLNNGTIACVEPAVKFLFYYGNKNGAVPDPGKAQPHWFANEVVYSMNEGDSSGIILDIHRAVHLLPGRTATVTSESSSYMTPVTCGGLSRVDHFRFFHNLVDPVTRKDLWMGAAITPRTPSDPLHCVMTLVRT